MIRGSRFRFLSMRASFSRPPFSTDMRDDRFRLFVFFVFHGDANKIKSAFCLGHSEK